LISQRPEHWANEHGIELAHIQPGKPAQNAYIERFNRTIREEVLDAYLFSSLEKVRQVVESWLETYNAVHPHESLQGLSPYQFAIRNA
jgi:putative transposase